MFSALKMCILPGLFSSYLECRTVLHRIEMQSGISLCSMDILRVKGEVGLDLREQLGSE